MAINHKFSFLICSERSGSNFITKILDSHPYVSGPSPVHLLRYFVPLEHKYGSLDTDVSWNKFTEDVFEFFEKKISHWDNHFSLEELQKVRPRSLYGCFRFIYESEAKSHHKSVSFIKENHAYRLVPYYLLNFPDSKFVWSFRDPRDMALSWKEDSILRGGIVRASSIWKEDQKSSLFLYNSLYNYSKMMMVPYELLTLNTEDVSNEICHFLDLPLFETKIELAQSPSSRKNAMASVGWSNLNKGVIKNNSKKYLNKLTEDEIRYIEYLCEDEMKQLGYNLEFPLLNRNEFIKIHNKLTLEEKYEKDSWLQVPEEEKLKRKLWTDCLNRIQSQFR